jgi:hypothetical protein
MHGLPGKYLFLTTLGGMTDENDQLLPLPEIMKSLVRTGHLIISMEDAYIIEWVLEATPRTARNRAFLRRNCFWRMNTANRSSICRQYAKSPIQSKNTGLAVWKELDGNKKEAPSPPAGEEGAYP